MTKKEAKVAEYGEWCYCPQNPGILRRIIGFNKDGTPKIQEKTVKEINKLKGQNKSNGVET